MIVRAKGQDSRSQLWFVYKRCVKQPGQQFTRRTGSELVTILGIVFDLEPHKKTLSTPSQQVCGHINLSP